MKANDIPIVLYSHSDYLDCLNVCVDQLYKYDLTNIILVYNLDSYRDIKTIKYDDNLSYTEKLLSCLEQINLNSFIYLHEDFIIYDQPKIDLINEYFKYIDNDFAHSIRLIRSGVDTLYFPLGLQMYKIIHPLDKHYAGQASVFKNDYLKKLLRHHKGKNLWAFEEEVQSLAAYHNNYVVWDTNYNHKRGLVHYDSNVFPYMATAICKGKWNTEYRKEISTIIPENIIKIRGWTNE